MIIVIGDTHSRPIVGPILHFGTELASGEIMEYSKFGGVRRVSYEAFAKGHQTQIRSSNASLTERQEIARRAESREGERCYSLLRNNCEHLANWCATGVAVSHQVIAFIHAVAALLKIFTLGLFVTACARLAAE